jgi:hypothetical protein
MALSTLFWRLSRRPATLELHIRGSLPEAYVPSSRWLPRPQQTRFDECIAVLEKATDDPLVRHLDLSLGPLACGLAKVSASSRCRLLAVAPGGEELSGNVNKQHHPFFDFVCSLPTRVPRPTHSKKKKNIENLSVIEWQEPAPWACSVFTRDTLIIVALAWNAHNSRRRTSSPSTWPALSLQARQSRQASFGSGSKSCWWPRAALTL